MIDVHCAACGRVLVGTRQMISMRSGDSGIEIAYMCSCGRPGAEVVGRRARSHQGAVPPAPADVPGPSGVRR